MASITQRNTEATVFVGDLQTAVNEEILFELFLQVGPVVNVHIPKDKVTGQHQGFGFVEFESEADAAYAINVLSGVRVYGQAIKVNYAAKDRRAFDVGANLYVSPLSLWPRQLTFFFSSQVHWQFGPRHRRKSAL